MSAAPRFPVKDLFRGSSMATLREAPGVAGHHCRRRGVSAAPCFPVKDLFRDRSLAALREARTGLTQAGRVSADLCPQVKPCARARFWSRTLNASFVVRGSVPLVLDPALLRELLRSLILKTVFLPVAIFAQTIWRGICWLEEVVSCMGWDGSFQQGAGNSSRRTAYHCCPVS